MVRYNQTYAVVIARCIDICIAGFVWREYDITISAHAGLELRKGAGLARWAVIVGGFLNWIETNHCELAIQADIERATIALRLLT